MKKILFCGTTNLDYFIYSKSLPTEGVTIKGDFQQNAGGKGANQAVACSKLGNKPFFYTRVSNDMAGKYLYSSLISSGVKTNGIKIIKNNKSGVALIFVDKKAKNLIGIAPGLNEKMPKKEIFKALNLLKENDIVVCEMGIPLNAIKQILALSKKKKLTTIFNPAPVTGKLNKKDFKNVDYITPNEHEAYELTSIKIKDKISARKAAKKLITLGCKNVIITLGESGAFAIIDDIDFYIKAPKVKSIDTTGAGDAFNGAFAFGLSKGLNGKDSLKLSILVGSLSTTKKGCQPAMPTLKELIKSKLIKKNEFSKIF